MLLSFLIGSDFFFLTITNWLSPCQVDQVITAALTPAVRKHKGSGFPGKIHMRGLGLREDETVALWGEDALGASMWGELGGRERMYDGRWGGGNVMRRFGISDIRRGNSMRRLRTVCEFCGYPDEGICWGWNVEVFSNWQYGPVLQNTVCWRNATPNSGAVSPWTDWDPVLDFSKLNINDFTVQWLSCLHGPILWPSSSLSDWRMNRIKYHIYMAWNNELYQLLADMLSMSATQNWVREIIKRAPFLLS